MTETREIYWHIPKILVAIHYALFAVAVVIFILGIFKHFRLWRLGEKENRFDRLPARFLRLIGYGLFQFRILKRLYQGLMHSGIFYGLGILYIGTLIVLIQADLGWKILEGAFYLYFSLVMDIAGLGLVVGLLMALFRRYVLRPPELWADNTVDKVDDLFIVLLFLVIAITGFIMEGLRMGVTEVGKVDFAVWSPIGLITARMMDGIIGNVPTLLPVLWFIHSTLVLIFIAYIPYSKIFHIFTGPANIFFSKLTPRGQLRHIDIETAEKFGVSKINDFSWKHLLDLDACTRCGRCETGCPTNLSDKPLKPKKLILDLRAELSRQAGRLSAKPTKEAEPICDKTVKTDEVWSCTTCHFCQSTCPVLIEHTDKIVELRRNLVLAESSFPAELKAMFKSMEVNGNPWPVSGDKRSDWCKGLDVKILNEGDKVDVLLWVGCAGATDDRNAKVAIALAKILKQAGVDFGILGNAEKCCGDPVRQLGNEYLYQMRAQENIETLKAHKFNRILTYCPHCYHSLKNEYPQLAQEFNPSAVSDKGALQPRIPGSNSFFKLPEYNIRILHHSQFILELIKGGQLKIKGGLNEAVVYHDSCYLGRYNDIYDEPRQVLSSAGASLKEMPRRGERSFCCGAGGGRMWMEERLGKRINQIRAREAMTALGTCGGTIASACPYCLSMLSDGVKELDVADTVPPQEGSSSTRGTDGSGAKTTRVLDIAEVILARLDGNR